MEHLTLNETYELLGLPNLFDRYLEEGELSHWKCSDPGKIDFELLGKTEIHDGKIIIVIPFEIEGL